jgi:predicted HTH domain antitoxin
MAKATIEIPDERWEELQAYKDRLGELLLLGLSQVKIQEALLLYQRGLVSFGRAAEVAGLSEDEMAKQARAFGVTPHWSEQMAEEVDSSPEAPVQVLDPGPAK